MRFIFDANVKLHVFASITLNIFRNDLHFSATDEKLILLREILDIFSRDSVGKIATIKLLLSLILWILMAKIFSRLLLLNWWRGLRTMLLSANPNRKRIYVAHHNLHVSFAFSQHFAFSCISLTSQQRLRIMRSLLHVRVPCALSHKSHSLVA